MSINLTGAMSDSLIASFVAAVINAATLAVTEEGSEGATEEQLAEPQVRDPRHYNNFPHYFLTPFSTLAGPGAVSPG